MGGGDFCAHGGGRARRRSARSLLCERDAERDHHPEHNDLEQRSGQRRRAAVAEPEPERIGVSFVLRLTLDLALGFAQRLSAQAPSPYSSRSPFGCTISPTGSENSAIRRCSAVTRIAITSESRSRAIAAQSWRNVNTTGRIKFTT